MGGKVIVVLCSLIAMHCTVIGTVLVKLKAVPTMLENLASNKVFMHNKFGT